MKTLSDIVVDLQNVVTAATQAIADLQAVMAVPTPSVPDPIVEVDVKTAAGVATSFVPKV